MKSLLSLAFGSFLALPLLAMAAGSSEREPVARVCESGKETVISLHELKPGESRTFKNAVHTLVITRRGESFELTVDGKPAGAGNLDQDDLKGSSRAGAGEKADATQSVRKRVIVLTDSPSNGEKKVVKKVIIRDEDDDEDDDELARGEQKGNGGAVRQRVIVRKEGGETTTVIKDDQRHIEVSGDGKVVIDEQVGELERCTPGENQGMIRAIVTD